MIFPPIEQPSSNTRASLAGTGFNPHNFAFASKLLMEVTPKDLDGYTNSL